MMERRCGFLKVDIELLETLLHIPPEHGIVDIKWGFANRQGRYVELYVEGPTLPNIHVPGERIPQVILDINRDQPGEYREFRIERR